ncbi:hypothetical protein PR048_031961 [Dryococelus australis]|uniref:Uncharacterized protein n=1 Tax=Dryococelus australis TaxID=614101 RepID=A0ABQ9G9K1_9NEOP|nr:hypothetical protein PR048_031961 [Dryococelus australis]
MLHSPQHCVSQRWFEDPLTWPDFENVQPADTVRGSRTFVMVRKIFADYFYLHQPRSCVLYCGMALKPLYQALKQHPSVEDSGTNAFV